MNNHSTKGNRLTPEVEAFLSKDNFKNKRQAKLAVDRRKRERWSKLDKFN